MYNARSDLRRAGDQALVRARKLSPERRRLGGGVGGASLRGLPQGCPMAGEKPANWPFDPDGYKIELIEHRRGGAAAAEIGERGHERRLYNPETESWPLSHCHCTRIGIIDTLWKAGLVVAKLGQCTSKRATTARSAAPRCQTSP